MQQLNNNIEKLLSGSEEDIILGVTIAMNEYGIEWFHDRIIAGENHPVWKTIPTHYISKYHSHLIIKIPGNYYLYFNHALDFYGITFNPQPSGFENYYTATEAKYIEI